MVHTDRPRDHQVVNFSDAYPLSNATVLRDRECNHETAKFGCAVPLSGPGGA